MEMAVVTSVPKLDPAKIHPLNPSLLPLKSALEPVMATTG